MEESSQNKRGIFLRGFFKFARRFLNIALSALFLVLAACALSFFFDLSVPAPSRMRAQILSLAQNFGIKIEAEEIRAALNGRLCFTDLKVSFANSKEPLFTAKNLKADFNIFKLLGGRLGLRALYLQGCDIYSGFGGNSISPVFENLSLNAYKQGDFYKISFANFYFEKLCVSLCGNVSETFLIENLSASEGSSKNSFKQWDDFCEKAHISKQYLKTFNFPAANIEFDIEKDGSARAFLRANSLGFSIGVSGGTLKFADFTSLLSYEKKGGRHLASVEILSSGADFGGNILAKSCKAFANFNLNEMRLLNIHASLSNLNIYGAEIGYAEIMKDSMGLADVRTLKTSLDGLKSFLKIGGGRLDAAFSGGIEDFSVKLNGNFLPEPLLKCSLIPEAEELGWFKFSDSGVNLSGGARIKIGAETKTPSVECGMFLDIQNSLLFGVDASSLSGDVCYNSESGDFWARDARAVSKEGWVVDADIYQNLKTFDYKFMISGSLRPSSISHFMEQWWKDVFEDFKFVKDFPHADIVVYGTWGNPEIMDVYGFVSLKNAYRNDVLFEDASLVVWVNPSRISIFDLYVGNAGRTLTGALNWVYFSGRLDSYNENRIYADSTLNREELIAMGGEKVKENLEILDFDEAPKISLNLLMKNPSREKNAPDIMNLDYECAGNTRAGKFELQDLKFKSYIYGDDIYLYEMDFGIASGHGSGDVFVGKRDGKDYFSANLDIERANQQKFMDVLLGLSKSPKEKKNGADTDAGLENSKYGLLNASVDISGFSDFLETFKGKGKMLLENPKLATINLFGLFSRLTSVLRLPVGSFELSKAESPFEIEDAQISFDDIKITGPAAKIIGKARYDFDKDAINANLIFSPFSEVKTPLVSQIMSVVNPISSLAEIEVRGNFDNPDVSINLRPLNVFKSDESIMEKFERKMDAEEEGRKKSE